MAYTSPRATPSDQTTSGSYEVPLAHRALIAVFIIATATPLTFQVAGAYLNVHRALMLVMIVPLIFGWVSGKAPGKIIIVDVLMIIHALWMLISLLYNHSPNTIIVYWLSQATETLGPYLLARIFVRDKDSFLFFVKCSVFVVIFLLPFAMVEAVTGRTVLVDIFESIPATGVPRNVGYGERLGLTRAQVTFEHPILYGVYCAIPLSLTIIALRADGKISTPMRWIRATGISAAVFFSVSSGALAAAIVQTGLILWDAVLKNVRVRWHIFGSIFAAAYVFVSIVSNRAPLVVLISYVTFSTSTAYNRVLIWRYGTDDVMGNPFFGIGLNDWSRPTWLGSSVDNFWLLWAMRYGLVGFLLFAIPIVLILYKVIRRNFSKDPALGYCRKGYVFSVIGVSTALATVAFWGGAYAMLCFLIGSGVWMMTAEPDKSDEPDSPGTAAIVESGRYTRFTSSQSRYALSRTGQSRQKRPVESASPSRVDRPAAPRPRAR